ncbi:hypothetical protein PIB30_100832, partial [Stylosanthes scabra]|nr:hypothetical protein [Stylosanthes scabra]
PSGFPKGFRSIKYPKCFLNTPWGTQRAIDGMVSKTVPLIKANEKSSLPSDRAIHLYIKPFSAIALGHAVGLVTEDTSSCPEHWILAPHSKSFGQSLRIRP